MMLYLSQLLGAPAENAQEARTGKIGKIVDILTLTALVGQDTPAYPSAILVEGEEDQPWRVSIQDAVWDDGTLRLRVPVEQLATQPETLAEQEISLAHDVMDKQVIDIARKKTVRVNDIAFGDDWRILGVDNSAPGLVRRLIPGWLTNRGGGQNPANLIAWQRIELIDSPHYDEYEREQEGQEGEAQRQPTQPMARVQSGHLAELHPADIAEIVHQLTPVEGARLIEGLDNETAADTMEEIDTERQRLILENIQAERAADILDAMGPDEAADLLSLLSEERAQELLHLMQPEESEEVQDLLEYEEDTAGGLMTTDYIALDATKSVADALEAVRVTMREEETRQAYVYCIPDENADEYTLLGIVSLWDLLIAPPTQSLQDLMETDMITVQPDTDSRTVAQTMAKYNLFAVPVVNEQGHLEGVITVDDALDVLLPTDKRRRPSRMY